jgi:hypothetical protein
VCSGNAGVCFKPPTGQGFEDMQSEVVKLLSMDEANSFKKAEDSYGYQWLVIEDPDIEQLVTQIHMVNSSLSDSGWGPQLLCSVFGLADLPDVDGTEALPTTAMPELTAGPGTVLPSSAYLVYLFKRGTFYPFIPDGKEHRNIEAELKLKSLVANDLTVEAELDRWFPLWDLPVG